MTTLLARLLALVERGVVALERIADASESIATMSVWHESGHSDVPAFERPAIHHRNCIERPGLRWDCVDDCPTQVRRA